MTRLNGFSIAAWLTATLTLLAVACGGGEEPRVTAPSPSPTAVGTVAMTASPAATEVAAPSPTSAATEDTAEWNTYTNTKYGYEIRYPLTASIEMAPVPAEREQSVDIAHAQRILIDITPTVVLGFDSRPFLISVQPNPNGLSAEEHLQELKAASEQAKEAGETLVSLTEQIQSEGPLTLNGLTAYSIIQGVLEREEKVVYLATDDFIYRVAYTTVNNPSDTFASAHYDTFELMLSTFRFIE
jgi:hypothetical protein